MVESLKEEGNTLFKTNQWREAITKYSGALDVSEYLLVVEISELIGRFRLLEIVKRRVKVVKSELRCFRIAQPRC